MKTIITLLFISFSSLLLANELHWVDEQIEAIKPARVGLKAHNISKITDPFIFVKSQEKTIKKSTKSKKIYHSKTHRYKRYYSIKKLHLAMTMNKSAKINGKWYKLGDTIHGYKIVTIDVTSVTLRHHKKDYLISTNSKNKTLKFKH